jgi:DNA-binding PadR family transcriptional regulator
MFRSQPFTCTTSSDRRSTWRWSRVWVIKRWSLRAAVRRQIEKRTGRLVSPGAIYTAMDRLGARGFVASRIETTPADRGGRRQKYYRLERAGAQALERSYRMLNQMARGLGGRLAELASVQRGGRRR